MSTILVVDDAALDRRLTGGLLEKHNDWRVEYAANGSDALSCIQSSDVDLVVTDLQMPEMDGLNLVQAIRVQYTDIPVVLITGHGSEALAVKALEHGAASYVPKDKLAEMLPDTVEDLLHMTHVDRGYQALIDCMTASEFSFSLHNDFELIAPLTDMVQQMIQGVGLCDSIDSVRVGVAVEQAVLNAMFRGNLEISYEDMQQSRERLMQGENADIVAERGSQPPYDSRRADVAIRITKDEARFIVADEGPGFDTSTVPESGDASALDREGGRGLVLIKTFMDDVVFNDVGNQVTMIKRAVQASASADR